METRRTSVLLCVAALAVLVAVATGTIASAGERTPIAGKPSAGTDPADASAARAAAGGAGSQPSEPAPIAAEPLTPRSVFVDDISLKITIKLDRGPTRVVNVDDPSRTVVVRYTVQPGAQFPWHSHLGPVVVNVVSGALTYVDAETCVERTYTAGQAFVDPGQGHVHTAFNPTSTPTVFVATFFAAPATGPLLIPSQRTATKQSEQARGNRSRSARFPVCRAAARSSDEQVPQPARTGRQLDRRPLARDQGSLRRLLSGRGVPAIPRTGRAVSSGQLLERRRGRRSGRSPSGSASGAGPYARSRWLR